MTLFIEKKGKAGSAFMMLLLFAFSLSAQTTINLNSVADAQLSEYSSTLNNGTSNSMLIQTWGSNNNYRGIIRFDISSIPSGATISSAEVKLQQIGTLGYQRTINLHAVTAAWNESTITWSNFSGQFNSTASASHVLNYPSSTQGVWNVTSDIQAMVNGSLANNGWLIKDANESEWGQYWTFGTREHAGSQYRPVLVVTYNFSGPPPIDLQGSQTNSSCFGSSNGIANVVATGGTGTYDYQWTPSPPIGQGTEEVSGLSPGYWEVLVTDLNNPNNTATLGFTILEPSEVQVSGIAADAGCSTCSDGSIVMSSTGGTPPYQWSINGGVAFETQTTYNNLMPGTYSIQAKDGLGCLSSIESQSVGYIPLTIDGTSSPTFCNSNDGSINVAVYGGTPPYTFQWSSGQTTEDLSGLTVGQYELEVKDAANVIASHVFQVNALAGWKDLVGVEVNTSGNLQNSNTQPWGSAQAKSAGSIKIGENGSFNVNLGGTTYSYAIGFSEVGYTGTPFIQYRFENYGATYNFYNINNWTGGGSGTSSSDVLKMEKEGLQIKVYINDVLTSSITLTTEVELEIRVQLLDNSYELIGFGSTLDCSTAFEAQAMPQTADCGQQNGSIDLTVTGGFPPYTYQWTDGPKTEDRTNLYPSQYQVTITDQSSAQLVVNVVVGNTITWDYVHGITINTNGSLTKNLPNGWNAPNDGIIYSAVTIDPNENGSITMNVPYELGSFMFGLDGGIGSTLGNEYLIARYWDAMQIRHTNSSGYVSDVFTPQVNPPFWASSGMSIIRIEKLGTRIIYYYNNSELYRGQIYNTTIPLRVVLKLHHENYTVPAIGLGFCEGEVIEDKEYNPTQRHLNSRFVTTSDGQLNVFYKEQYGVDHGSFLNYEIVNAANQIVYSSSDEQITVKRGKNKISFDCLSGKLGNISGYYLLRITNANQEVEYLRFYVSGNEACQ